ncbi:MAG: sigma-70 family RNA polymerase sigma factor [Planctomycetota bacterium]
MPENPAGRATGQGGPLGGGPAGGLEEISDERLFVRYREGEDEPLRELIRRHHADLMRFLFRLTSDRALAEDAFQETFLQLHQSAGSFDSSRRLRPWLFTIAANKARDLLRKKGRRQAVELSKPVGGNGSDSPALVDLLSADLPGPGDGLEREERERLVQRAIDQLTPTLKEILLLAYFQRLSYAQIAEDLGIPLGTVKSRLHSAVAAFARAWARVRGGDA